MRVLQISISAAFAVALATLTVSTAEAQPYPPQTYPLQFDRPPCSFPLEWPFCAAGAVLDVAATIIAAPIRLLIGAPPLGYYGLPYYPPPPPYYPPPYYPHPPPPPNYYAPH